MAVNYPGPYELRVNYTVTKTPGGALDHQLRLNIDLAVVGDPGDDFDQFAGTTKNGTQHTLDIITDDLVAVIKPFFNSTDCAINNAELWEYEAGTFNATYITAYDISDTGGVATATVPGSQVLCTMRTTAGGIMKFSLQDIIVGDNLPFTRADFGGSGKEEDLAAFLVDGADCYFQGRDNARPLLFLKMFYGQNENTFKRRYR